MTATQTTVPYSSRRIALASSSALVAAVLIVVGAVLPAEYGLDPLGTGGALGLLALSRVQPIEAEDAEYMTDVLEIELVPGEWVESTYEIEEGSSMLFSWTASGAVSYNFHSAPDGAPPGYAESFDAEEQDRAYGAYTAPFTGVHGWYWENRGSASVTITLTTVGFYSRPHLARDRATGFRSLRDARGELVEMPDRRP